MNASVTNQSVHPCNSISLDKLTDLQLGRVGP